MFLGGSRLRRLRENQSLVYWLARLGYGSRGVVYLVVGGLALMDAVGAAGQESVDSKGALEAILRQPFGRVLLGVVTVGLAGYALWRLVQSWADTDGHGTNPHGLAVRSGLMVSSVTHAGLAMFALNLTMGLGGDDSDAASDWTATLLQQEYGDWLVIGVGLAVIGAGMAHLYKGATAGFEKYLTLDESSLRWARPVCQFGLLARGAVFLIIGGFFIVAAVRFQSGEARGLKGALDALEAQVYGPWLLATVAVGLFAFGIYSLIEATHRRIDPPSLDF